MLTEPVVSALAAAYDVVLLDIGDTLVAEAAAGTPTAHLVAQPLPGVLDTMSALRGRVRLGAVTNTSVMREVEVRSILESVGSRRPPRGRRHLDRCRRREAGSAAA